MIKFSKKTCSKIKKLIGKEMETVRNFQYKRNTSTFVLEQVADLYEEETGKTISRNWSCSTCQYNFIDMIQKIYYNSI